MFIYHGHRPVFTSFVLLYFLQPYLAFVSTPHASAVEPATSSLRLPEAPAAGTVKSLPTPVFLCSRIFSLPRPQASVAIHAADEMSNWSPSSLTWAELDRLASDGMLSLLTAAEEWRVPGPEAHPQPPSGSWSGSCCSTNGAPLSRREDSSESCSRSTAWSCRTSTRTTSSKWRHSRPCARGIWRREPTGISLLQVRRGQRWQLRGDHRVRRAARKQGGMEEYIQTNLPTSNSGWHRGWFYLKNDPEGPLPELTGRWYDRAPASWSYGPDKRRIAPGFLTTPSTPSRGSVQTE
jgi:hypothetical protein